MIKRNTKTIKYIENVNTDEEIDDLAGDDSSATYTDDNSDDDNNTDSDVDSGDEGEVPFRKDGKDIREIIFEDINDNYSWGKYCDFKVIMMKSNGYFNATKMCDDICKITGSKKPFRKWKVTTQAQELIFEIFSSDRNLPDEKYSKMITGGRLSIVRGTYVHPDLIPHIASWASPKFAVKVSKIVNEYFSMEAYNKHKLELAEKDHVISKLNVKLDKIMKTNKELLASAKKQNSTNKKLLDGNKELLTKNSKMNGRIKGLQKLNNAIYGQNVTIQNKLDSVVPNRVIPTGKKSDIPQFILFNNNIDPDDYEDEEDIPPEYTVARLLTKCAKKKIAEHKAKYPNAKIILRLCSNPNTFNLWHRVKRDLIKSDKIVSAGINGFNLENITEKKLKETIVRIHDERLEVDDE